MVFTVFDIAKWVHITGNGSNEHKVGQVGINIFYVVRSGRCMNPERFQDATASRSGREARKLTKRMNF